MTTTADVREALAGAASRCGVEVYAYEPDMPLAGSGWVTRREFDPRLVFSQAKAAYPFVIVVLFNRATATSSQQAIDALSDLTGDGSLIAAVQDGDNWTTTVDYASVTRVGEINPVELGGAVYLSVEFDIEVVW